MCMSWEIYAIVLLPSMGVKCWCNSIRVRFPSMGVMLEVSWHLELCVVYGSMMCLLVRCCFAWVQS
jgi:hypothetical protein